MTRPRHLLALAALCLVGAAPALAQGAPPARPADVSSIDSIITTLYAVISGPAGQPRQWDRFHSLMHPEARLIPTRCDSSGKCSLRIMTPAQYQQRADSFLVAEGFTERELKRSTERYGAIAHAFSSYQSFRRGETDAVRAGDQLDPAVLGRPAVVDHGDLLGLGAAEQPAPRGVPVTRSPSSRDADGPRRARSALPAAFRAWLESNHRRRRSSSSASTRWRSRTAGSPTARRWTRRSASAGSTGCDGA